MPAWAPTSPLLPCSRSDYGLSGLWLAHASRGQALAELLDMHVATLASANRSMLFPRIDTRSNRGLPGTSFTFICRNCKTRVTSWLAQLVYLDGKPAAQLVYGLGKHEISVFVFEERLQAGLADFLRDDKTSMREKVLPWSDGTRLGSLTCSSAMRTPRTSVRCLR